ncbi:MAG: pilus assembly protein PilB, partial [Deltaproteobacteria bacterium]|nr:pilus assembly protein PilB [Deltaproteobacteria bacterium]
SSFEVINRFIHMGIEPYNLVAALNCIIAQRLIRILCQCKEQVPADKKEEYLRDSGLDYERHKDHKFYMEKALGCDLCKGSGFRGRRAIIEILEMNDDMKELFMEKMSITGLKKKAKEAGTTFLREAALELVLNGETSISEANRVTFIEQL